jgi:adenylate kinase
MANRRICAANGHVYNLTSNPPLQPGICDIDGAPLTQREDDQEETVRARMSQQIPPLLDVIDHYRKTGVLRSVDGRLPIDEVSAGVIAALDEGAPA